MCRTWLETEFWTKQLAFCLFLFNETNIFSKWYEYFDEPVCSSFMLILKMCLVCLYSYLLLGWTLLWTEMVKAFFLSKLALATTLQNYFFFSFTQSNTSYEHTIKLKKQYHYFQRYSKTNGWSWQTRMDVTCVNGKIRFVGAKLFDCLISRSFHHLRAWQKRA